MDSEVGSRPLGVLDWDRRRRLKSLDRRLDLTRHYLHCPFFSGGRHSYPHRHLDPSSNTIQRVKRHGLEKGPRAVTEHDGVLGDHRLLPRGDLSDSVWTAL